MTKTVVLARARNTDGFCRWLLTEHAPLVLAPLVDRITLQIVMPDAAASPPYDAIIELWSGGPISTALAGNDALAERAVLDIRQSHEIIAKDDRTDLAIGITPGISQLSFVAPIAGMLHAETLQHWSEHIVLAREIHVGMSRYVQDRLAPGAAPWFGMAHLHFPDEQALRDGLFRTPADIEAITADVAEFVGDYATMLAVEHVLKI